MLLLKIQKLQQQQQGISAFFCTSFEISLDCQMTVVN